jgi:hypothetical protein
LDSAPQKSTNLAKIFKKVFNSCKNAGMCYLCFTKFSTVLLPCHSAVHLGNLLFVNIGLSVNSVPHSPLSYVCIHT